MDKPVYALGWVYLLASVIQFEYKNSKNSLTNGRDNGGYLLFTVYVANLLLAVFPKLLFTASISERQTVKTGNC